MKEDANSEKLKNAEFQATITAGVKTVTSDVGSIKRGIFTIAGATLIALGAAIAKGAGVF